jgi:hypothetical protein
MNWNRGAFSIFVCFILSNCSASSTVGLGGPSAEMRVSHRRKVHDKLNSLKHALVLAAEKNYDKFGLSFNSL